jgi:glutamate N-acetyltransferase/amino-acid N-acetyltransferase
MAEYEWLDEVVAPRGVQASGVRTGIKSSGLDLALIVAGAGSCSAAVFTQNRFCAAPVLLSRENAVRQSFRSIVANSGCANACTGDFGLADAREMAELTARQVGCDPEQVLVASTGVIGRRIPMPLLRDGIPRAITALSSAGLPAAAEAILTTDTRPKSGSVRALFAGEPIIITGMVKGSGMIAPNMATCFAFFATDARIDPPVLQDVFARAISQSINRVTVDGDTSTNDTACILSSCEALNSPIQGGTEEANKFESALTGLAQELARRMAADGEGAEHLITVRVCGAGSETDADVIAMTVANSPLVKTAIFGKDPNWGRIAAAAGRAGVAFDATLVDIRLNGELVAQACMGAEFDEAALRGRLAVPEVEISIDLHAGDARAVAWTCDFSYDYVKINAEYHT